MLHDPHRDLSLLGFRDYAASRNPHEAYDFSCREQCACAQFARHIGLFSEWNNSPLTPDYVWGELNAIAHGAHDQSAERWTWGGLRTRLDAALGMEV